jgi:hypothetical protein
MKSIRESNIRNDRHYRHFVSGVTARLTSKTTDLQGVSAHSWTATSSVEQVTVDSRLPSPRQFTTLREASRPMPDRAETPSTVTTLSLPLDSDAAAEFLEERSAIAEYDGQLTRESAEAQARADLLALQQVKQKPAPAGPRQSKNKIHMFTTTGTLTNDPAKCHTWTREERGYDWWHASQYPPPAW